MIAEKAKAAIELAVGFEYNNITTKYGDKYASEHEGYAILKEEIEEAADDLDCINKNLVYIWALVKNNHIKKGWEALEETLNYAIALAEEATQVAAVCERFLETIK
jgi:hypothetical protein